MCVGGAVGLHGGGRERGVPARGAARRPAQGGLCRLVVRASGRYVDVDDNLTYRRYFERYLTHFVNTP